MIEIYPASTLIRKSRDISEKDILDYSVRDCQRELKAAMSYSDNAVAVAAPQVGIGLNAFYFEYKTEAGYVFNPKIVGKSKDIIKESEGCLSLPGYYFNVWRPETIEVEALNVTTGEIEIAQISGFLARIFQHEIDHLEGILIPFYMDDDDFEKWENHFFEGRDPKDFKCKGIRV